MAQENRRTVAVVSVENLTTQLGLFVGGELAYTWSLTTPAALTADEAFAAWKDFAAEVGLGASALADASPLAGGIVGSVVPPLTEAWAAALSRSCGRRAMVAGPGLKSGLKMGCSNPSEVGADRIADALAAKELVGVPVITVNLTAATTMNVVDAAGVFAGGVIAPGLRASARALADLAAQLPVIEVRAPRSAVGKNTREAMQSGVVLGEAARIDGLLDMLTAEIGENAKVVLTGNDAATMAALLRHDAVVEEHLTLRGLFAMYRINERR